MEITIEGQKRPEGSKPNALRRQGLVPAVLYGHQGAESINITISAKAAETLMKRNVVNHTLIQLNVPELSWSGKTLLREVQKHPWKGFPYHLSFFSVAQQDSLTVSIPLHFVGEAVGVKLEGGLLDVVLSELEVDCEPGSIPDRIDVDVTSLHQGQALHIRELNLPAGVTATGDAEQVVVSIIHPERGEEESSVEG
ncbi:50S ribosomal protein L25/general stress protein Ctc [Planktothrix sp. FACHB-1365]|uniref:50S ribosomal protein L25/general stress protein Ctc n=1 Tax=Planktothrix sp. FACHB-1365 TaxID=2692855 RepID=UPI00168954C3|nr:50S ribosomal protein L25/general stress protein Ctc [Planktothrix sp. FACHB-1365]MBD2480715.1 50S ribosomal protein L25/general stress protein Ctc [Planktothrix sp. FACHB-1365]